MNYSKFIREANAEKKVTIFPGFCRNVDNIEGEGDKNDFLLRKFFIGTPHYFP